VLLWSLSESGDFGLDLSPSVLLFGLTRNRGSILSIPDYCRSENFFRMNFAEVYPMSNCSARLKLKKEYELSGIAATTVHDKLDSAGLPNDQFANQSDRAEDADRIEEHARNAYLQHVKAHHCLVG
jgi:hypothetical protein